MIRFENTYAKLPEHFYARVNPDQVPAPQLIRVNDMLAQHLQIDPAWLRSDKGLEMLSGNGVAEGSEPLAQAYAGHQFGGWSPQLGDGRAHLLGEVIDTHGDRKDIQLKGSGATPFSRRGDGKAALGPALREYLVSEAMSALGVPTTRALAVLSTGEKVARETLLDGGIIVRVASSHLRVGTFQYFYAREDDDALRTLVDYAIERHFPDAAQAENKALGLLQEVIAAQGRLVAHWMSLGFIHGVMNTDNCAISGETIDYGPCAFMDTFHPECVFSAIDSGARYAWGNQAMMAVWNISRFAETLLAIIDPDLEKAKVLAEGALKSFSAAFSTAYDAHYFAKLGMKEDAPEEFITETLELLQNHEIDYTLFFRELTRHAGGEGAGLAGLFAQTDDLDAWLATWESHRASDGHPAMKAANPILIPRNHRIEQAIEAAYAGDFAPFHRLTEAWQKPFEEQPEFADLEVAPEPHEVVQNTFCGT